MIRANIFKRIISLAVFLASGLLTQPSFGEGCEAMKSLDIKNVTLKVGSITREHNIQRLINEKFDTVIIGGGSAGLGAAVDAASRGLKVALLEHSDFAAETSSRSTKLLHGGVRYLLQLVVTLVKTGKVDKTLLNLIKDALRERDVLIKNAPHLAKPIPIVTPVYKWFEIPYYMIGLKMYDALSGKRQAFPGARFVTAKEMVQKFPMMNADGLKGGVEYYDGQFNDSRMAVALAMTAQQKGAAIANHTGVTGLVKDSNGKVTGVTARDNLTGQSFEVQGKVVINATGPFSDTIRRMDDPNVPAMVTTSSGTHLVLSKKFIPPETGILVPKTEDGRVLFILPWEGHTLVGTTDDKAVLIANPQPTRAEEDYLLAQVAKYYAEPPTKADVLSKWTGLRPLVSDPKKADTANLARDHVVQVSDSNLVTIVGGKWTTYRKMALDVVDHALKVVGLDRQYPEGQTDKLVLVGGEGYAPELAEAIHKKFQLEKEVTDHLIHTYGDRSFDVLTLEEGRYNTKLVEGLPFLKSEVFYGIRVEAARTAVDILSRRIRLSFVDQKATLQALPSVVEILGNELGWDQSRRALEIESAKKYLDI